MQCLRVSLAYAVYATALFATSQHCNRLAFTTQHYNSLLQTPEVDCGVDCVGFEAHGCGHNHHHEVPAQVLNDMMDVTKAGGGIGIPGLYVTEDPGASDKAARQGNLSIRIGLGWAKSQSFFTGQCPVIKYHQQLSKAILFEKIKVGG